MFKLLIADDEKIERDAIKYIVHENFGSIFEICEAANGREVIEQAAAFQPEIIFLDIKMPGINGLEAAAEIKATLPECRIIMVSAYHYFNYAQEAMSIGADEYITKPASAEKVVETIGKVIFSIEETLAKKKLEAEKDQKLKQLIRYFEDDLLVLVAYGEIDENMVAAYFETLNIRYRSFLSAIVSLADKISPSGAGCELEKRTLKKRIADRIKSYFHMVEHNAFIRPVGQEIYVLLLLDYQPDEYESRLMGIRLFSEVRELILKEMEVNVNIGIGNICFAISEIYSSFLQARSALRYDMTPGTVISFGDVSRHENRTGYPIHKEKKLYQCMLQSDLGTALILLEELMDWFWDNLEDPERIKEKVYELLLMLHREITLNTHLSESEIDTGDLRRTIFFFDNIEDLRLYAREFTTRKMNEMNSVKTSRADALLTMAVDFLEHNYPKDISLEDVAAIIQISPFYLSKLFKKALGENFIDYLTGVRIRKAKEFLANPLYTIKDVCYQVGYKDPNYFARVFKKICGITPTEFQAKNL